MPLFYVDSVLLFPPGTELPLIVESFGLLNDLFPFPSILDAGYPIFDLHLANVLFDVGSRDGVVSIATRYRLEGPGI